MNATDVEFLRQDAVNDYFRYTNENGEIDYVSFPRTMEMSLQDVIDYLND